METIETVRARARRAYELRRAGDGLRMAALVLGAGAVALVAGRPAQLTFGLVGLAAPLAAFLTWRGGAEGKAVGAGFAAGVAALSLPLLVRIVGHACFGPSCMVLCQPACIAGGAVAGAVIALRGAREEEPLRFTLGAAALAGLLGSLGCSLAGAAGVAGMIAGAVGAGTPALVYARARR